MIKTKQNKTKLSMESQRVRHELAVEQQKPHRISEFTFKLVCVCVCVCVCIISSVQFSHSVVSDFL